MRKIILHSPQVDRQGHWHDAGSELTVGAGKDHDLDVATADRLVACGRAVVPAVASLAEPKKA